MQVIKKVLNSSVILVEDERGVERVLLGKGLGYGAKPGQPAPSSATDRVFIALEDSDQRSLVELLAQIPVEFVELTRSVVADAADAGLELDPHIYLALTDHLHFAVERQRRGLAVTNRLAWEMKTVYPLEYQIGVQAVARLQERLGVDLPAEEAANIAFHLVNAESGRPEVDSLQIVQLISQIKSIVTNSSGVKIGDDLHAKRFIAHLQFFAERLFTGKLLDSPDGLLGKTVRSSYPNATIVAERVQAFISAQHKVQISEEEVAYLTLHIARAGLQ